MRWPFLPLLWALSFVLLGLAGSYTAYAQEEISVQDSSVVVEFPSAIHFRLRASGGAPIVRAMLEYRLERRSCATVSTLAFPTVAPATQVNLTWSLDTRQSGSFPPGTVMSYRWSITDSEGRTQVTPEQSVTVEDGRFAWREVSRGEVVLRWYQGDAVFAGALLDAAVEALDRLEGSTGVRPTEPVRVYVYGSSDELRSALVFPQEWTGGIAMPDFNAVLIGVAPQNLDWGERAVTHELTHVVLGQYTFNCYVELPSWLNEGLATYNEGSLQHVYQESLAEAVRQNRVFTVRGLSGGFPTDAAETLVAYAQSASVVAYLVEGYGAEKLDQLLRAFSRGRSQEQALQEVYGFGMAGLDQRWRERQGLPPLPEPTPTPTATPRPALTPTATATSTAPAPSATATPSVTATAMPQPATGGFSCNVSQRRQGSAQLPLEVAALGGILVYLHRRRRR